MHSVTVHQNGPINEVNANHQRRPNVVIRPPVIGHPQIPIPEQLKKSWCLVLISSILFLIGTGVIFWNEGKAARVSHSLEEAFNKVIKLSDSAEPNTEYEGRLIYISGILEVSEPLTEPEYGIIIGSIKLKRRVQIFQWIEIQEERYNDDTNYYYTTEWEDKLIDSDHFYIRFGHENPKEALIKNQLQIVNEARIGSFVFSAELKKKFVDYVQITSDERPEQRNIKMHSGLYYHSEDLWNPKVGDVRIQFSCAGRAGDIYTVVGMYSDGRIEPYITVHGEEILFQRKDEVSLDLMFHLEHRNNYWRTWKMRGFGWFLNFLAANLVAPILKSVIKNSSVLNQFISPDYPSFTVSMSMSLLVMGYAWIWYRPLIGLCMAIASFLPFMYFFFFEDIRPRR